MAETMELGLEKAMDKAPGQTPGSGSVSRVDGRNKKGTGLSSKKKVLLAAAAVVVLAALVIGGIQWSKRGVVTVQTGKVARQDLSSIVTASGQIKPPPEGFANVNANSFGKITAIYVKEGDQVKKGQLLLRTESVQQEADVDAMKAALRTTQADSSATEAAVESSAAALKTSQADVATARARLTQSKDDFARGQQLVKDQLIARQVFDQRRSDFAVAQATVEANEARVTQAKAQYQQALHNRDRVTAQVAQTRAQLVRAQDVQSKTIYTSPLDGILTSLPVHAGENVVPGIQNQPGSVLFQVSDLSVITAEVKVDEADIVNVKLGQPAEVTIDAIPNKTFKGHVTKIGQSAIGRNTGLTTSNQNQTAAATEEAKDFMVVATLDEPPSNLRPGLSTTAKITTATRQNAVTIPIQALTIRTRRELEEAAKDSKGKALAAGKQPDAATSKDKEKEKEELQGVFAVRGGSAVFVPLETGIMGTTDVEIVKGLQAGDEIITGSYQVLRTTKNKTKVKVDNSPAAPPPSPPS